MTRKKVFLFLGPLLAILLYFSLVNQGLTDDQSKTAAVLLWVGFWWMTEPVNLYITSLLPLLLLPLLNVMTFKDVAPHYMEEVIFLFIGGFLFAFAMEKWNLHNRIAL